MADRRPFPWGWLALAAGSTAAVGGFLAARSLINDGHVPQAGILPGVGRDVTVLAIWAHPDDEITCAGTLARMAQAGAKVVLLYLTQGEAAKGTGYDRASLAKVRAAEAQAAGEVLGASVVEVLDFPDGGLLGLNPAGPKGAIAEAISRHRPQVLISFDETVGFYGHPDHVRTGVWVREVFEAAPKRGPWPRLLYQVTLPRAMVRLALKLVEAFRDNYPADPARGLPPPQIAVNISRQWAAKRALLDVHASQKAIIADVQPGYDKVPGWLYYRLFDREYFVGHRRR